MRTIKFRAWDKLDNKMYYDVGLSLIGVQVYAHPESQPPEDIILDRGRDCFEIMQFTGILDKNGKEIYEGDIVRILYTDWPSQQAEKNGRYTMTLDEYKNSIAAIKVVVWQAQGFYVSHKLGGYTERMEPGTHGFIEIIGNIYENPDLLK